MLNTLDIVLLAITTFSVVFGGLSYRELRKWARQCQNAEIAVGYKKKVQLRAPLVEWLTWANALGKDEAARGRIIYRARDVYVAIIRPRKVGRLHASFLRVRGARRRRRAPVEGAPVKPIVPTR